MLIAAALLFTGWVFYLVFAKYKPSHSIILGMLAGGVGWALAAHQFTNSQPSTGPVSAEVAPAAPHSSQPAPAPEAVVKSKPAANEPEKPLTKKDPAELTAPVYDRSKFNMRLALPSDRWRIPPIPSSTYPSAGFIAKNLNQKYELVVIPEDLGNQVFSLDSYVDIVMHNQTIEGMRERPRVVDTLNINGCTFKVVFADYSKFLKTSKIVKYLTYHRGYAYQLSFVFKRNLPSDQLVEISKPVVDGFTIIDPKRWSPNTPVPAKPESFLSHGFAVDFAGAGWTKLSKPVHKAGVATWQRGEDCNFTVYAYDLGTWNPTAAVLKRAMISGMIGEIHESPQAIIHNVKVGEIEGIEQTEVSTNPKYAVITRVFRDGSRAWMLRGACLSNPKAMDELRASLDGFRPLPASNKTIPVSDAIHANIQNHGGLGYTEASQLASALECYLLASKTVPSDVTYATNVMYTLLDLHRPADVVEFYQSRTVKKSPEERLLVARAHLILNQVDAAMPLLKNTINSGLRDDDEWVNITRAFTENEHYAEAAEILKRYLKDGGTVDLKLWLTFCLINSDHADEAIVMLKEMAKSTPKNQEVREQWADALIKLKRIDEALVVINQAIADFPTSASFHRYLGNHYADKNEYDHAVTAMEKAAALAPRNEGIQNDLAYFRARLGRGHDRDVRQPLEIVPLPAMATAEKVDMSDIPLGDAHSKLLAIMYDFTPGKICRRTYHREQVIHSPSVIANYNTLRYSYSPLSEKIFINYCEVLDKNGKKIATADPATAYVTDVDDSATNSDKYLCIPVPGLAVGCTIRSAVTISDRSPRDTFEFDKTIFLTGRACERFLVGVQGSVEMLASHTLHQLQKHSGKNWVTWQRTAQPATADESLQPDLETYNPTLYLGPKGTSWTKLVADYQKDIAHALKPDDDITSLAREIAGTDGSPQVKALRIFRWMQTNLTYKAIEFGSRARIPNPAPTTCHNRYGDCKDFSILLVQMLRANGIQAIPCLVHTDSKPCSEIPSLDQFDHMIVYLPAQNGLAESWLDPTESIMASPFTPRPWLKGTQTLVIDSTRKNPLVTVPVKYTDSEYHITIQREISRPDPAATVAGISEKLTFHSTAADYMRGYLRSISAAERTQRLSEFIADLDSDFRLDKAEIEQLDDLDKPLLLTLHGTIDNIYTANGNIKHWPSHWENSYLDVTPYPTRRTPFVIYQPWHMKVTTTASVIPGRATKPVSKKETTPFGSLSFSEVTDKEHIHRVFDAKVCYTPSTSPFPAAKYQSFVSFWKNALKLAQK